MHCGRAFQIETFPPTRQRGADPDGSALERSHEPGLGFFPRDGGVRVGFQVPETLLDKRLSRISQRPIIQPLLLPQVGEP